MFLSAALARDKDPPGHVSRGSRPLLVRRACKGSLVRVHLWCIQGSCGHSRPNNECHAAPARQPYNGRSLMSKVHHLVGATLACVLATSANAQLLHHKDLSSAIATTIALAAVEACKAAGYNVSVHVVGRNGEVLVGLRHHAAGVNTFENSWKKAYTSRTFRIPSGK